MLFAVMFFLPKQLEVQNSRIIDMPTNQLFQQFNEPRKFNAWHHWAETPLEGADAHYYGPISGLGSGYQWRDQNKDKYSGRYEIIETIPNKRIKGRLSVSGKSAEIS